MLGNILPPYHSLQELNLDWILTKIKNMLRFLPDDGAVGQILRRTPHGAEWSDEQGAGGSVTSVNGMQGAVVLDAADVGALPDSTVIPDSTSDLINDSGFVDAAGAAASAPVQSVNGQTGTVVLTKSDVGLGNVDNVQQYSASNPPPYPVTSVNGQTGAVTVTVPTNTSDLNNDSGFVDAAGAAAAAPVQSVNGQTGAVVIATGDTIHTAFLSRSVTFPSQSQGGYVLFGSKAGFGIPAAATIIAAEIVGFSNFSAGYGGIGTAISSDGNNVYLLSVNSGTGTFGVRVSYIE